MSTRIKPSIFDVPVSMFGSASDTRPRPTTLHAMLEAIQNGKYRAEIEHLRALSQEEFDIQKKLLPAFSPAGTFRNPRSASNLEAHSGFIVLDFDDVPHLPDAKFRLQQDPYTAACFISVSGGGLKVLGRVKGVTTAEEHKAMFPFFAEYYRRIGLNLDMSGSDVSRLCFVSWDANLYRNEQAKMFSVEEARKFATPKKPVEAFVNAFPANGSTNHSHKRKIALKALEIAKTAIRNAPKGTRHDTRLRHVETVGGYLQEGGLTESEVRAELLPIVQEYSDTPDVAEKEFEEFLKYGKQHPMNLDNEAEKQRQYAESRNGQPLNGIGHKKSPAPEEKSEAKEFSKQNENTAKPASEQEKSATKKKSRSTTRQQTKIEFVEAWLSERYAFRNNVISGAPEFCRKGANHWQPIEDYQLSSIWRAMEKNDVKFSETRLQRLILSDFAERFNPFKDYFSTLPKWDGTERISDYAGLVKVQEEQTDVWQKYFRRWIIGLVATALQRGINTSCLVIVGAQNMGKNTYFENLLPSALRMYYNTTTADFSNTNNKDADFMLASNLVIMLDEMESANKKEVGALKSLITRKEINARRPYDRLPKILPRYASFCGSVNHSSFLSDLTGSRRFLCVEASRIEWRSHNDEYLHQLYAEALHALESGETFAFSLDEIAEINSMNEQFQVASPEVESILLTFSSVPKSEAKDHHFYTTTQIMTKIQERFPHLKTGTKTMGIALEKCGFEKGTKRINTQPVKGWYAKIAESV